MKLEDLSTESIDEGLDAFYISFGDLMVILCVFLVMLLAMSDIEVGSFEKVKSVMTGQTKNTLVELEGTLGDIIDGTPGVPGASVYLDEDGVRVDLDTGILFAQGRAIIETDALNSLEPILTKILATPYHIDVEGHTDDVAYYRIVDGEIITNWSLAGRRASSLVVHLRKLGFTSKRLRIVGYADTRPVIEPRGKSGAELEKARALNRRVSLLVR